MKTMKNKNTIILFLYIFLSIFISSFYINTYAANHIWDFTNPADYTLSDPSKIEIADDIARLVYKLEHTSSISD